jgi:hypothetical protein
MLHATSKEERLQPRKSSLAKSENKRLQHVGKIQTK